jgi:hypothetical protein
MGGTINEQFPVGVTKTMVLEGQLRRVTAERDQLRAELAKEKANASLVGTWEQAARKAAGEDGVQFVGPNTIFAVSDKLRAENTALAAHVERLRVFLIWLDRIGGLGLEVHARITEALAATPAQSLAARDVATKEPSPFLSRAAWRVVKEVWVDVAAGRMNARSAVADAALDLRGLLEESGPEPADDVVGVERKAETTFGGYLAAHDAALLREVAKRFAYRRNDGDWTIHPDSLTDEADRIEKEAL